MSRVQSTPDTLPLNESLKKMGFKAKVKCTNQTPYAMITLREGFEDGSKTRSTGIRWDTPHALESLFTLAIELCKADAPLASLRAAEEEQTLAKDFSGWTALTLTLQVYLDKLGLKWRDQDYERHIKQLAQFTGPVTAIRLQKWAEATPRNSRDRVRRMMTLRKIQTSCKINFPSDWMEEMRSECHYDSTQAKNPREIPSDAHIEQFIDRIPNPKWQAFFAFMATYGLRPHEPFCIDGLPDEDGFIELTSKKTKKRQSGWRTVAPRRPDWIDRWNLRDAVLPDCDLRMDGRQLGNRASTYLARNRHLALWRNGAQCYDLRHAFAAAFHTKPEFEHLTLVEVAKSMGHSVSIHELHYMRWIEKADLKAQAKRRLLR